MEDENRNKYRSFKKLGERDNFMGHTQRILPHMVRLAKIRWIYYKALK